MMHKISRPMIAFWTAISTLLIILVALFTYFYANGTKNWWAELFQVRIFYVPVFVHFLAVSAAVGIFVYLLMTLLHRLQYTKIEEKLRVLAAGNYDSAILKTSLEHSDSAFYVKDIEQNIQQIKEKMLDMSSELQQLTSRPQYVSGETKEEILAEERHRLARELHDSVSQQLFAAMMMLSALNEQSAKIELSNNFRKQLALVADIINASQSEMRALLLHLRPVSLEGKTLRQGIEQLLRELQTKIQISLKWDVEELELPSGVEDHLFRIVQELLSNTLRHAKADELEVYLHRIGNNLLLRVVDDGIGFDMEQPKAGSYGLNNIRERVSGMGGTSKIISFKGQGTSVEIRIPLMEEAQAND